MFAGLIAWARRAAKTVRRVDRTPYFDPLGLPVDSAIVNPWALERLFQLKSGQTLTPGGTATAEILRWDGSAWSVISGSDFTVEDVKGKFRQSSPPTGQDGARGEARLYPGGKWIISDLQHQARRIHYQVNAGAGFDQTDATAVIDNITYYNGYQPTTAPTIVYNPAAAGGQYMYYGDDDDHGDAWYDITNNRYWIMPVEC